MAMFKSGRIATVAVLVAVARAMNTVVQTGELGSKSEIAPPIVHGASEKARASAKVARSQDAQSVERAATGDSSRLLLTLVAVPVFAVVICVLALVLLRTEAGQKIAAALGLLRQDSGWKQMVIPKYGEPDGWAAIALQSPLVQSAMAAIGACSPASYTPVPASDATMEMQQACSLSGESAEQSDEVTGGSDNALEQLKAFASSSATKDLLCGAIDKGTLPEAAETSLLDDLGLADQATVKLNASADLLDDDDDPINMFQSANSGLLESRPIEDMFD